MPHGASRLLLIGSICLLLAAPATVRAGAWTSIGPDGGAVQSVTFDPVTPSIVYAIASSDTIKSLDGGLTWFSISPPGFGASSEVLIDPLVPTTIYVTKGTNIEKSTDGGASWTAYPTNEPYAIGLAIDPANPSNLWIGGLGRVQRSTDGGVTWTPTALPPPATTEIPVDLAVDPLTPATLYAATSFGTAIGVYKSVDAGVSFTHVLAGVACQSLAIDPVSPSTVLAGDIYSGGVDRSTDGGTTWTASTAGLSGGVTRRGLAIDPTNPLVVYAGGGNGRVHKSVDGGLTWTPFTAGLAAYGYLQGLVIDPSNPATVLGGELTGVARSTDAGVSWTIEKSGIRGLDVRGVTVDPTDPNVLYVAAQSLGVVKSVDGGATWAEINVGVGTTYVERVLVDPVTPSNLYLLLSFGGGILRSLDGGATWIAGGAGLSDSANALALAPSSPGTLYAAAFNGVHKSVDGGVSWNPTGFAIPGGDPKAIAVDAASADVVYVGIGTKVYRSADGGDTWVPKDVLPALFGGTITALGVDPTDSTTLYAGISNGFLPAIYRSLNSGATWSAGPASYPTDIAFRPGAPSTVFVASQSYVHVSRDRGTTWSNIDDGLYFPNAVAVGGSSIYVGTLQSSLWRRSALLCLTDAECDDVNLCTTDTCNPGSPAADPLGCVHTAITCTPPDCHGAYCQPDTGACVEYPLADDTACADDGTICTNDLCRAGACTHDPVVMSCKDPGPQGSTLSIKNLTPARATLVWKWGHGDPTTLAELGDPFNDGASDYTLCGFDRSGPGGAYALAFSIQAPAGGTCGKKPCWTPKGVKVRYKDRERTPDGLDTLELTSGGLAAAKVTMTAKGAHLTVPAGPLAPDVHLQLRRDDDDTACWEAVFQTNVRKNAPGLFKAKSD